MSFGSGTLVLSADMSQLALTVTLFNIDFTGAQTPGDNNDNLTAAHIHASATGGFGINSGVVFGFHGTPFNDNNPNNLEHFK